MRATRQPIARDAPVDAPVRRDVIIRPAPVAMVWQGTGTPHAAIAVPGVSLGERDALVAVELATICPSDAAVADGTGASTPLVLGHEQVGRVVAVGAAATTSDGTRLVVGMRVVWARRIGCGECDACRDGETAACGAAREYGADRLRRGWELSGGFASHVLVRAGSAILTVPEAVPAAVLAPLSCATALAAAAREHVSRAVVVDGRTVVVAGADLAGLTVTAMLADDGARVLVLEPDDTRRSRALDFGARGVAAGLDDLARLTRPGRVHGGGDGRVPPDVDRPVAVVGSGALDLSAPPGAGVGVSGSSQPPARDGLFDAVEVAVALCEASSPAPGSRPGGDTSESGAVPRLSGAATVTTLRRTEPRHLVMAVDFASNAWFRYPFADLVVERFPLDRLDDALRSAASATGLRIAVDPTVR